jgi:DNA-binding GntR family transcriptional regulator
VPRPVKPPIPVLQPLLGITSCFARRSDAMRAGMGSGEPIRRYNVVMSAAHDSLLYTRVETVLAGEITDGDLKIGDQLPTEDSLIARFGVSRITVRRAIQNLVSRGLVEIRRGKGTFVAAPKIIQDLKELSGFVEDMHAVGRKPTGRVIGKEIVLPTRPWRASLR